MKYTEKISTYWPEFGQNGKGDITVADLMRHEAGLVFLNPPLHVEDTLTGEKSLEAQSELRSNNKIFSHREHQEERNWFSDREARATLARCLLGARQEGVSRAEPGLGGQ